MKLKKVLLLNVFALALGLAVFPSIPASAACSTLYVDNDDPNYGDGYSGTWNYIQVATSQRGDHRIHKDSSQVDYYWKPKQTCSSGYWAFGVYLNSSSFNNTEAWYYKNGSPSLQVNQDTAYAGWNTVETVYLGSGTTYTFEVSAVAPVSTQDTGADMIRFVD